MAGQSITVYEDKAQNQRVLVAFETNGVGSVSYKNGKPWLVVTREGWTVSDPAGNIMERGKFPRQQTQAVTCDVNRAVRVVFANRQDIVLSFKVEGLAKEWQCGEQLKRTESHLDKVRGQGRTGQAPREKPTAGASTWCCTPHRLNPDYTAVGLGFSV